MSAFTLGRVINEDQKPDGISITAPIPFRTLVVCQDYFDGLKTLKILEKWAL